MFMRRSHVVNIVLDRLFGASRRLLMCSNHYPTGQYMMWNVLEIMVMTEVSGEMWMDSSKSESLWEWGQVFGCESGELYRKESLYHNYDQQKESQDGTNRAKSCKRKTIWVVDDANVGPLSEQKKLSSNFREFLNTCQKVVCGMKFWTKYLIDAFEGLES